MADVVSQVLTVRFVSAAPSQFTPTTDLTPVIRVTCDPDDLHAYEVATNLGVDMSDRETMQTVGAMLHAVSHALLAPTTRIPLGDLEHPENAAQQPGGAS